MEHHKSESVMATAGGKIRCRRCIAHSSRTGLQCGRPALKASATQKCQFHGGRGSGPKTADGRAKISAKHTKHGNETRSSRTRRSAKSAQLSQLEDAALVLGFAVGPRLRGRKASGYVPVRTLADVMRMFQECLQQRDLGGVQSEESFSRNTYRPERQPPFR
jgi:hypothetical protein